MTDIRRITFEVKDMAFVFEPKLFIVTLWTKTGWYQYDMDEFAKTMREICDNRKKNRT